MSMRPRDEHGHGSVGSYIAGFLLSLLLTGAAFGLVMSKALSGSALSAAIVGLALIQLLVQLLFFLHLGRESKPRWNLVVLSFAALVVVIVVFGSLWIMYNLNYHAMPANQTDAQIIKDEGFGY